MGNYTKSTDFAIKDTLNTGNSAKVIRGAEFETEFDAIAQAISEKPDANNSVLTGTTSVASLSLGGIAVTATASELNHVDGVTSAVQDQIDAKAPIDSPTFTTDVTVPSISLGDWDIALSTNDIVFSYLGTPKFKLATTGELTAADDLTAFGTL